MGDTGFLGSISRDVMSKEKIDEITRFNLLDVITLVYELQLNAVCAQEFTTKLYALAQQWVDRSCIREIHVKQLIGLSTMVKNLPLQYKGMLAHAYDNISLTNPTNIPAFFLVLVRFTSPGLPGLLSTIDQSIETLAKEVCPEARNFFGDLFTTIHAGGGSLNQDDTLKSLAVKDGKDASPDDHITVLNHVLVEDKNSVVFDQLVGQLLKVAQVTFQPSSSASGDGLAGGPDNVFYRKALSTEILRALTPVNGVRAYLMHGVWRTEWDHENSHADPRFLEAAKKLAPYVIEGPVEPFYRDVWHVS